MKKIKKKKSQLVTLLIWIFSFLTVLTTLISKIYTRKQVIKTIEKEGSINAYLTVNTETKEM